MNTKQVISIIGAGSLGKLYAGLLLLAHHEVHCLLRSEYHTIKEQSFYELKFNELDKTYTIKNLNIHKDPKTLPLSDFVIVAIKTTENRNLASLLASSLQKETVIIIIQNGIGNEEYFQTLFPHHTILSVISYAGVTRRENALTEVYCMGSFCMSLVNTTDKQVLTKVENLFPATLHPKFIIYENYKQIRWKKIMWNTPFCSLSVLFDKPTHILATEQPYSFMAQSIMHEIQSIAYAEEITITNEEIQETILNTQKMKDYYPSMYWDYIHNRPIEKEYIIDEVLNLAHQHNIPAPVLEKTILELNNKLKEKMKTA